MAVMVEDTPRGSAVLEAIELSRRIRAARTYADISQADMAERLGMSAITYKRLEGAKREPTAQEVQRISEITLMPADWFIVHDVRHLRAYDDERLQQLENIENRVGGLVDRLADLEYHMRAAAGTSSARKR